MIYVTEQAIQELRKILSTEVDYPGACLRLVDRGNGKLGLCIDREAPGDQIIEYEGNRILLVEPELADNLKGSTLDIENTPEGAELVLSILQF